LVVVLDGEGSAGVGVFDNRALLLASSAALSPDGFLGVVRAPHPPPNFERGNVDGVVEVFSSSLAAAVAWADCDIREEKWNSRRVRSQVGGETVSIV
jgi:hypothetical protein